MVSSYRGIGECRVGVLNKRGNRAIQTYRDDERRRLLMMKTKWTAGRIYLCRTTVIFRILSYAIPFRKYHHDFLSLDMGSIVQYFPNVDIRLRNTQLLIIQ